MQMSELILVGIVMYLAEEILIKFRLLKIICQNIKVNPTAVCNTFISRTICKD